MFSPKFNDDTASVSLPADETDGSRRLECIETVQYTGGPCTSATECGGGHYSRSAAVGRQKNIPIINQKPDDVSCTGFGSIMRLLPTVGVKGIMFSGHLSILPYTHPSVNAYFA